MSTCSALRSLREVQATVDKAKPLMLTHEVEKPKGGGPLEEVVAAVW